MMRPLLVALLASVPCLAWAGDATVESEFAAGFFRERIQPLFVEHCYECHGNGRRKGGLSMATRAALLAGGDEGVVLVPGDTATSTLIPAIRWEAHDEELNMPPKARLPEAAIADLTRWVAMGAPWPTAARTGPPAGVPEPAAARSRAPLAGRLHPLIVHFPIACLLLAVLAELLVWRDGDRWRPVTAFLLLIGAAATIAAVISGTLLADGDSTGLRRHQLFGWVTAIASVGACLLLRLPGRWPLRTVLALVALLAGFTGHLGGVLVYGEGWFSP